MAFHRIKKYSRQVVYQDCVLACQPNHISEIPSLKRAQVSGLSLRDQKMTPSEERGTWLERELDLSGMLLCWHLLNSRSVPFLARQNKVESGRRIATERRKRVCDSLVTLRDHTLYMAIERYLLFLMPREMKPSRFLYRHTPDSMEWVKRQSLCETEFDTQLFPLLTRFPCRRDCIRLSTLYMHTALGVCQYKVNDLFKGKSTLSSGGSLKSFTLARSEPIFSVFARENVLFPCVHRSIGDTWFVHCGPGLQNPKSETPPDKSKISHVSGLQNFVLHHFKTNQRESVLSESLSLYCSSVLRSPEIQDIAQSGLVTLEGDLTLEVVA